MTSRVRKCCASRGKGGVRLTFDRNQSWSPQKRLMWHSGTRKTFAIDLGRRASCGMSSEPRRMRAAAVQSGPTAVCGSL